MPFTPSSIERGTVLGGKYRVLGLLGEGGMGAVYQAVNDAIGRTVALKVLDARLVDSPEFKKRFELEARAAATIGHPGIVDVLDVGETRGVPFIVMEFLDGLTVRSYLQREGPLSPPAAAAVVLPVLETLSAAHAAGVIHRDLKPANLFLVARPRPGVKVLDFGISKFASVGADTSTGSALGTPAFMAPEQLRGVKVLTPAADLYALGAVLYTLLAGRTPYQADSDYALVGRVLTEAPTPLNEARPGLPAGLAALVHLLLSKEPTQRPSSAEEVSRALKAVVTPDPGAVWRPGVRWSTEVAAAPARPVPVPSGQETKPLQQRPPAVSPPTPRAAPAPPRATPTTPHAQVPGLLYRHTLKAFLDRVVFRRGLLSQDFQQRLKALGVDATRPTDINFETWLGVLELTAQALGQGKPRAQALHEVGQEMIRGYETGVVGKALFLSLRMMGPRRMVHQITEGFRTADSIMHPVAKELRPNAMSIEFAVSGGVPTYIQGVLTEAATLTGVKGFTSRFEEHPDGRVTYFVEWT